MTQARATESSRIGFLFDGWRPRVLATLGYLLTIAGLLAVAITGTDSHGGVASRPASAQAVSAPASASAPSGPPLAVLQLAADRP